MNNYSKKSLSTFKANVASIMANKKAVETKSEFTNVYFSELQKETEKAYLIDGKWYPKSACGMFLGSETITGIEVKTWFLNK